MPRASRPAEFHRRPLSERCVNLSARTAPSAGPSRGVPQPLCRLLQAVSRRRGDYPGCSWRARHRRSGGTRRLRMTDQRLVIILPDGLVPLADSYLDDFCCDRRQHRAERSAATMSGAFPNMSRFLPVRLPCKRNSIVSAQGLAVRIDKEGCNDERCIEDRCDRRKRMARRRHNPGDT